MPKHPIPALFPVRLVEARRRSGLSQRQLAHLADVAPNQLSGYEAGHNLPQLPILASLATALDVTADYLLGLDRSLPPIAVEPHEADRLIAHYRLGYANAPRPKLAHLTGLQAVALAAQAQHRPTSPPPPVAQVTPEQAAQVYAQALAQHHLDHAQACLALAKWGAGLVR